MPGDLRASVYVSSPEPFLKPDGTEGGHWSPISSTLIYGQEEAVLVDTAITQAQNIALGDWIERTMPDKRLKFVYITHGHADHWLGIGYLKERFPGLRAIATEGTIKHMKEQIEPGLWNSTYGTRFPGKIDTDFVLAECLLPNLFTVDDQILEAVEVGHSDTHSSTVLWVPSLRLAVCGDVVYGNVHQQLRYAKTKALRAEWITAVEKVEALGPETVIAGHKEPNEVDGTWHLEATKEYIRNFDRFLSKAADPAELFKLMTEQYPTRFNTNALAGGCAAAFSA